MSLEEFEAGLFDAGSEWLEVEDGDGSGEQEQAADEEGESRGSFEYGFEESDKGLEKALFSASHDAQGGGNEDVLTYGDGEGHQQGQSAQGD